MVQYKLIYFNARGAAELIRLVFRLADIEFDDVRVEREDWPKHKPEMPTGTMPVLEVDGVKYSQSAAITRYLAKKFDLMGSSATEELLIDELQEVMAEITARELRKVFFLPDGPEKSEAAKKFVDESFPKYLNFIEMRLKQNNDGDGFYVGEKVSLADLLLYNSLTEIDAFMKKLGVESTISSRKLLTAYTERVGAIPNIAKWLKERPPSAF